MKLDLMRWLCMAAVAVLAPAAAQASVHWEFMFQFGEFCG